jgi:hypothetical protein
MITISVTNSLYILPSFWASGALADIGVYRPVCIVYIPSKIQHPKFEIIPSYNLEASPVPLFERAPFVVNPNSLTASPYSYSPSATPRPHQTSAFQRVPTTLFTSQQNHVFLLQVASEGIWFLRIQMPGDVESTESTESSSLLLKSPSQPIFTLPRLPISSLVPSHRRKSRVFVASRSEASCSYSKAGSDSRQSTESTQLRIKDN